MRHLTDLASTYPDVQRSLEAWAGYRVLAQVLKEFDDLDVFLAGGVVRNCILDTGDATKDFDFFLSGPSTQRAIEAFRQHGCFTHTPFGSPRWHPDGDPECYADLIPIGDFKPGLWKCEDIVDVLNQFDFTANALAFDLRTGSSFDPQNGFRDVTRRIMRMVRFDYPEEPFRPGAELTRNAVLWFRVLHYASAFALEIEPLTRAWLSANDRYRRHAAAFGVLFFPLHRDYLEAL